MVEEVIRDLFAKYPEVLYGFADISYSTYADCYRSALVYAVPYGEQLTLEDYTEERFENGIKSAKVKLEEIMAQIEDILKQKRRKASRIHMLLVMVIF